MRFRISHLTRYSYAEPVSLCHSILHLKPRRVGLKGQQCLASQLRIDPWPAVNREHEDFFGNRVNYFSIQQSHSALEVTAISEVEVSAPELPDAGATLPWEVALERLHESRDPVMVGARIFALPSPLVPQEPTATAFAAQSFTPRRPILEAIRESWDASSRSLSTIPTSLPSPPRWRR